MGTKPGHTGTVGLLDPSVLWFVVALLPVNARQMSFVIVHLVGAVDLSKVPCHLKANDHKNKNKNKYINK